MDPEKHDLYRELKSRFTSLPERSKLLIQLLILSLSACGFLVQITQVSMQYFAYRTTTQVFLKQPIKTPFHTISFCSRYAEILDAEQLFKDTGIKWKNWWHQEDALNLETRLTIEQIFRYTPKNENIIDECIYRENDLTFVNGTGSFCEQAFKIHKYFTQEYICYAFEIRSHNEINRVAAAQSTFNQFMMFEIFLNKKFEKANRVNIATYWGDFPYYSRDYSSSYYLDSLGNPKMNYFEVIPSDFEIDRMKAPYDTKCRDSFDWYECNGECLKKGFQNISKIPASLITVEPLPLKVIGTIELRNDSFRLFTQKIYEKCVDKCMIIHCHTSYSKTMSFPQRYTEYSIGFSSLTPIEPTIQTVAQATMTGIDFFSFVSACFGTWFGFSCLSIFKTFREISRHNKRNSPIIYLNVIDSDARIKKILRIQ